MSDLIRRQDAIDALDGIRVVGGRNSAVRMMRYIEAVRDRLKQLPSAQPTIDAVEVVRGKWKIDEYGIYHCPICHAINNTVYKSFCPNCGMRSDGEEQTNETN